MHLRWQPHLSYTRLLPWKVEGHARISKKRWQLKKAALVATLNNVQEAII
jgi:hypothetical protein